MSVHEADLTSLLTDIRSWGQSGRYLETPSGLDTVCVPIIVRRRNESAE
jgi:hypothetical protein